MFKIRPKYWVAPMGYMNEEGFGVYQRYFIFFKNPVVWARTKAEAMAILKRVIQGGSII